MAAEQITVTIGADTDRLERGMRDAKKEVSGFESAIKKIGPLIAGAFAVDKISQFLGYAINTTAEFEKYKAVLTNTLGSQEKANKAFEDLSVFAAKTPFQLNELTGSYVKLVNQGFKPTMDEMRKLGDVAASQGKSFEQLTEAIIDAQTGEFERLKEFGIRAQKQGDQVAFTFKGVKTQVDFTNESIRNYILGLGEAEGVAGSMDAISKTMGGSLSNLQDSFSYIASEIGNMFTPAINSAAKAMGALVDKMKEVKSDKAFRQEMFNALGNPFKDGVDQLGKSYDFLYVLKKQMQDMDAQELKNSADKISKMLEQHAISAGLNKSELDKTMAAAKYLYLTEQARKESEALEKTTENAAKNEQVKAEAAKQAEASAAKAFEIYKKQREKDAERGMPKIGGLGAESLSGTTTDKKTFDPMALAGMSQMTQEIQEQQAAMQPIQDASILTSQIVGEAFGSMAESSANWIMSMGEQAARFDLIIKEMVKQMIAAVVQAMIMQAAMMAITGGGSLLGGKIGGFLTGVGGNIGKQSGGMGGVMGGGMRGLLEVTGIIKGRDINLASRKDNQSRANVF